MLLSPEASQAATKRATPMPPPSPGLRRFRVWTASRSRREVLLDGPCHIQEHVLDRAKWPADLLAAAPEANGGLDDDGDDADYGRRRRRLRLPRGSGARPTRASARLATRQATAARRGREEEEEEPSDDDDDVARVLGRGAWTTPCQACGRFAGEGCRGRGCYGRFMGGARRAFRRLVEVRDTGTARQGRGVFVRPGRRVAVGAWLGEYVGELLPPPPPVTGGGAAGGGGGGPYVVEIPGVARVDAAAAGGLARFANHHCRPNARLRHVVVGRRHCVLLQAVRAVPAGAQLCVAYGCAYFVGNGLLCACDAQPRPHLPAR